MIKKGDRKNSNNQPFTIRSNMFSVTNVNIEPTVRVICMTIQRGFIWIDLTGSLVRKLMSTSNGTSTHTMLYIVFNITCSISINLISLRLSFSLGSLEKLVRRLKMETRDSPISCDSSISRFLTGTQDSIRLLVTMISRISAGITLMKSRLSDRAEMVAQGSRILNQGSASSGRNCAMSGAGMMAGRKKTLSVQRVHCGVRIIASLVRV